MTAAKNLAKITTSVAQSWIQYWHFGIIRL